MGSDKIKYKLVFADKEDYDGGMHSLDFGIYFEIFNFDYVEKDPKNFTIIIESWSDYFIEYTFRREKTHIYKDGSRDAMPIKVYFQKWMGWSDYTRKITEK